MTQQTLTSGAPYFDDFDVNKEYYAMLFNPARAVQARELTQMQTILQNQLGSFAQHIFHDNSIVINANIEHSSDKFVFDVLNDSINYPGSADLVNLFLNKTITSNSTTAKCIFVDQINFKLTFEYISGSGFDDTVESNVQGPLGTAVDLIKMVAGSLKNATVVSNEDGIVYIDGKFLLVKKQQISVDSGTSSSYHIGYVYNESIKTITDDSSLGDPSAGTNNSLSGADRYSVTLTLSSYVDGQTVPTNFIEFYVVENEVVIKDIVKADYSEILEILAERTFDTNGNYTTKQFPINIEDHPTDSTKLTVNINPGKAYVNGYEAEVVASKKLDLDKARSTVVINNDAVWSDWGTYFKIANTADGFDMINLGVLAETPNFALGDSVTAYAGGNGSGAVLGTFTATGLKRVNDELRLYVTDVNAIIGSVSSIVSIGKSYGGNKWYANLHRLKGYNELLGNATSPIIEYENYPKIKNISNISYFYNKQFKNVTVNGSNQLILNASAGDSFGGLQDIISVTKRNGTSADVSFYNTLSLTGQGTSTLTITNGTPFTIGDTYDVNLSILSTTATPRTKTLQTLTESTINVPFVNNLNSSYLLGHEDVVRLTRIYQTDNFFGGTATTAQATNSNTVVATHNAATVLDVTKLFRDSGGWLDNGQREVYYETGEIVGLNNLELSALTLGSGTTNYIVVYDYYIHSSSGKCFTSNSYSKIEDISVYSSSNNSKTYNLVNCLDFRYKKSELNLDPHYPYQGEQLTADLESYLLRIDTVYINKSGDFAINKGIPSLNPNPPLEISDTMVIYTLHIPAYTKYFSSVKSQMHDNKNYTMRDIGSIERRVSNLEEVTSLTMLEKSTDKLTILDNSGLDMFKSGIFVDSFSSKATHNRIDPEYNLSINETEHYGTGRISTNYLDMTLIGAPAGTNVAIGLNTISLAYTENTIPLASNDQASSTVAINPFDFKRWHGTCKLTPNFGPGSDIELPPIILPDLPTEGDDEPPITVPDIPSDPKPIDPPSITIPIMLDEYEDWYQHVNDIDDHRIWHKYSPIKIVNGNIESKPEPIYVPKTEETRVIGDPRGVNLNNLSKFKIF